MMTEGGKPVLDDGHSWMVRGEASMEAWRSANEKFTAETPSRGGDGTGHRRATMGHE